MTRMLILAISAIISLGGCIEDSESSESNLLLIEGNETSCYGQICNYLSQSQDGIQIRVPSSEIVQIESIWIANLTTDVTISGAFSNQGTFLNILGGWCKACTLNLQGIQITGSETAIRGSITGGRLIMDAVEIQTLGGGTLTEVQPSTDEYGQTIDFLDGGTQVVNLDLQGSHIEIIANAWSAQNTSILPAMELDADAATSVEIDGLNIRNYDTGLDLEVAGRTSMARLEIACERRGIINRGNSANWIISSSQISGCTLVGITATNVDDITVEDTESSNSMTGLTLHGTRAVLRNVTLESNRVGLLATGFIESNGEIRESHINNNGILGSYLAWDNIQVSGTEFHANGQASTETDTLRGGVRVATKFEGTMPTLRGNSFVGNSPMAISYPGTVPVDARDSWWGSPLGPAQVAEGIGAGDAVNGLILTTPHRLEPLL